MKTRIGRDLEPARLLISQGQLVAFPTETVYGLGANTLDPVAVAKIFEAKGRPRFDPLIVHVADFDDLSALVTSLPPAVEKLADAFWPGPLTLVLPKSVAVPDLVTSGLPSVAVRIPRHPLAQELLRAVDVPLAAPSANRFGKLSPTTAEHVAEQLAGELEYILDGGPCDVGVESTVVDLTSKTPRLLRPGGVTLEDLEDILGKVEVCTFATSNEKPAGPGMLLKHYAPLTPVKIVHDFKDLTEDQKTCGLLTLCAPPDERNFAHVEVLSSSGNLQEASANFFAAMRRLDAANVKTIVAQPFPETGLGRALNDRLLRAANSNETAS